MLRELHRCPVLRRTRAYAHWVTRDVRRTPSPCLLALLFGGLASATLATPAAMAQATRSDSAAAVSDRARHSATGSVHGIVVDSLFVGGPLSNAEVWIDGTTLSARTDASGRFRLEAVPLGRHRVTFSHAALTAQRISAPVV
jgi:hypothetical protein